MKKLISLLLSLIMVICVAGCSSSCKSDKDTVDNDDITSSDVGDDDDIGDDEDNDEDFDDEDFDDEDFDEDEDEDWEDWEETEGEDNNEEGNDDNTSSEDKKKGEWQVVEDYEQETLEVYNSETPINTEYRGFSSTIYHAFGFMKDDNTGRVYTDKMMNTELDRLVDTGVHYVRTRYDSHWMWTDSGYDWNSARFGYFCDYAKAMDDRDVDIILQVGWHFGQITRLTNNSIIDVDYLNGDGEDKYAESAGFDFSECSTYDEKYGTNFGTDYYVRIIKAARRYGYWVSETLNQLRARGINNVTHISYMVEPVNGYSYKIDTVTGEYLYDENNEKYNAAAGEENPQYLTFCRNMKNKMSELGTADTVEHMGTNETEYVYGLKFVLENDPTLFTTYTSHSYPKSTTTINDVYYYQFQPHCAEYIELLKDAGVYETTEFWLDEFNAHFDDYGKGSSDAYQGIQNAVCAIAAQQEGIENIVLWQLFDQLWTDKTTGGREFENGIHMTGNHPSLFVSATPYAEYYATGLFTKYNGYKNGTVYATNLEYVSAFGLYIGAVKLEDGNWTVSVVNMNADPYRVVVNFDEAINQTLYRHLCTATEVDPTPEAVLPDADKTFVNVGDEFTDVIPAGSLAIYTGVKG